MDDRRLTLYARAWTLTTLAHVVPFVLTAGILILIEPWLAPMSALALVQAWIIPELYANRGAKVVRPKRRGSEEAEPAALGLPRTEEQTPELPSPQNPVCRFFLEKKNNYSSYHCYH